MITRDNEDDGQVDRQPLGVSLAGCSFTGRILHTPFWVRKNAIWYERFPVRHRGFDCLPAQPIPAAHTTPPAMSVMPAMNRIVSARVSNQSLRMLRLNRWTVPGRVVSIR